jgi:hypothetical protein
MKDKCAAKFLLALAASCLLLLLPVAARSGKRLALDADLLANADVLKVRLGLKTPGKMGKFTFGEYALVSSWLGPEISTTASPFFSRVETSRSKQTFSFVLKGAGPETATVKAAQDLESQSLRELAVASNLSLSAVDIAGTDADLIAAIALGGDHGKAWTLILNVKSDRAVLKETTATAFLADGRRTIAIVPVTSNPPGAKPSGWPALGYEFSENGKVLGAVQYFGGGILGQNRNIVYLRRDLEPRTKLLLAAAMTAILQAKIAGRPALD